MIVLSGCSAASGGPTTRDCDKAQRLISAGFPQQASSIVGTARSGEPDSCNRVRAEAQTAVSAAASKIDSRTAATPEDVAAALRLDHENVAALTALTALQATAVVGTSDARLCATAKTLVRAGLPRRALSLVGSYPNGSVCAATAAAALDAVADAAALAMAAEELKSGPQEAVHAKADEALSRDQENIAARLSRAWTKPDELTRAEQLQKSWKDLSEGWLAPLGSVALPAVIIFAGLLLAARLLTAFKLPWRPRSQGPRRAVVAGIGFGACAVTGLVTPVAQLTRPFPSGLGAWLALFILAVIGIGSVTSWLATGTRLMVTATDEKGVTDAVAAARLLTFLADLGGEKPRGSLVARATDVSVLDVTGFEAVAVNKVISALLAVLRATVRVTPWTVTLASLGGGLMSSTVYRNGRPVGSDVIDGHRLGLVPDPDGEPTAKAAASSSALGQDQLPAPTVHLERLAAAQVLTKMAKAYEHVGFEALDGAMSWTSLGLQYVAQTDLDNDDARAEMALIRAVDAEPHRFAHYNLLVRQYRMGKIGSLDLATRFGASIPDPNPGQAGPVFTPALQPMRQRMLYLRLATLINAWYEAAPDVAAQDRIEKDTKISSVTLHEALGKDTECTPARQEIRPGAACLLAWVENRWGEIPALRSVVKEDHYTAWINIAMGSLASYQLGCLYATADPAQPLDDLLNRPELPAGYLQTPTLPQRAIACFKLARKNPRLQNWMDLDPQLNDFRQSPAYREAFYADPATDVLSLTVLRPHHRLLKSEGLTDIRGLVRICRSNPVWLRNRLHLQPVSFVRINQLIAVLAKAHNHAGLSTYAVELAQALTDLHALDLVDESSWSRKEIRAISTTITTKWATKLKELPATGVIECLLLDLHREATQTEPPSSPTGKSPGVV